MPILFYLRKTFLKSHPLAQFITSCPYKIKLQIGITKQDFHIRLTNFVLLYIKIDVHTKLKRSNRIPCVCTKSESIKRNFVQ